MKIITWINQKIFTLNVQAWTFRQNTQMLAKAFLPVGVSLYYLLLGKRDPHLEDR